MELSQQSVILPVPHLMQRQDGECLAACAAMLLGYAGRSVSYVQLLRLLSIHDFGAPFSNIRQLERQGVTVSIGVGDLDMLHAHLLDDQPCAVSILTGDLPYWPVSIPHAVVVVGMDKNFVYLNDPAFVEAPVRVSRGDFDLAWLAHGEMFAAIRE